jgi:glycosyltransferase involved in cell wall biosynthesis
VSQNLKICILGPAFPYKGGIATFNDRLATELHNQGHSLTVVTFSLQYPSFLFPGKSQTTDEIKDFPFPIFRKINAINPFNWIKVGKELSNQNFDLVISRFWIPAMAPSLGFILRKIKKNRHTKVTAIIDNLIPHEKRFGDAILSQYFLKSIDSAIAMSASVQNDIINNSKNNLPTTLIPHPLYDHYGELINYESACSKMNLDIASNYILFFGLIRKYKGLDLLINAMPHILKDQPNIKLIIAGEFYDSEKTYRDLVANLNIEDSVIFYSGFIPDDQVADIFSISKLLVLPYKTATQSGISQMAMHFTTPMVVTNVGGLPEIVEEGKTGYIVSTEATSIASAIKNYFAENKEEEFKSNILIQKQSFTWPVFVKKLLAFANKKSLK